MFRYLLISFAVSTDLPVELFFVSCFSRVSFFLSDIPLLDTSRSSCTCARSSSELMVCSGALRRFNSGASSKDESDKVLFIFWTVVGYVVGAKVGANGVENVLG